MNTDTGAEKQLVGDLYELREKARQNLVSMQEGVVAQNSVAEQNQIVDTFLKLNKAYLEALTNWLHPCRPMTTTHVYDYPERSNQ